MGMVRLRFTQGPPEADPVDGRTLWMTSQMTIYLGFGATQAGHQASNREPHSVKKDLYI